MPPPGVVVTGLGPVTPVGVGAGPFHAAQLAGRSGVRTITRFDATDLSVRIAGEVDIPDRLTLDRRISASTDRCTQLMAVAAQLAIEDSCLDLNVEDPARIGAVIGTGIGGIGTWERNSRDALQRGLGCVSPRFIPMAMPNNPASWIATRYGITGPTLACTTACASGAHAVALGHMLITSGQADVVLVGGAEAPLTPLIVSGFANMHALSRRNDEPERASRPFSLDRDGFVLAEGAAVLVLESIEHATSRDAAVHAEFAGFGITSDAYHMTQPRPDGVPARRAIETAMTAAHLAPSDVSYVNAHGTGTAFNDASETAALRGALGYAAPRTPVSSTKSLTGHPLGAAGAIEAIASIQAIMNDVVPPTANLERPDPQLGLDFIPLQARPAKVRAVLSNSFAFGGHNVVLAFTRF